MSHLLVAKCEEEGGRNPPGFPTDNVKNSRQPLRVKDSRFVGRLAHQPAQRLSHLLKGYSLVSSNEGEGQWESFCVKDMTGEVCFNTAYSHPVT
jgi:hypothetical protein